MSVAEVTGRISEIQSALARLAPAPLPAVPPAGAGGSFATVLGAAEAGLAREAPAGSVAGSRVAPAYARLSAAGTDRGQAVVAEATKYLGVPYRWGGTDPATGLDCSGLVQLVYRKFGVDLPRVSYQQATAGRAVPSLAQARPGDILAFGSPVDHVAIYAGEGKMVEAPRTGLDVRVVDVSQTPTAIRRVLPDGPAAGPGSGPATGTGAAAAVGGVPGFVPGSVPSRAVAGTAPAGSVPFSSLFQSAGDRYGVDPLLLAAVARQESGFDPTAVSHAGAQGLMQLMPATADGLGVANPFDPAQAVDGAARLLRDLLSEFGRVDLALAAYNAGPGAVKRYGGVPPYPETQNYVPAVLAHHAQLERA